MKLLPFDDNTTILYGNFEIFLIDCRAGILKKVKMHARSSAFV